MACSGAPGKNGRDMETPSCCRCLYQVIAEPIVGTAECPEWYSCPLAFSQCQCLPCAVNQDFWDTEAKVLKRDLRGTGNSSAQNNFTSPHVLRRNTGTKELQRSARPSDPDPPHPLDGCITLAITDITSC